jgi:transcriptional regulator with XRE-family HTH domain
MSHVEHPEGRHHLGTLIRAARERARLSRAALAKLCGLSEGTLKNVEAGKEVTACTLRAILQVRELGLPEDLAPAYGADTVLPNAWYAPGFAPIGEFRKMLQVLQGQGGLVEQSYLYFDHQSAADWAAISSQQDYADAHRVMPLDRAALSIFHQVGERGLDVIALGPGTGHLETRLVALLAEQLRRPAIRYYLLDISQPLLAEAYRLAAHTLALFEGIVPIAVQGNFYSLPQFGQMLYSVPSAPRRQVVVLLGGTFANLENEARFIRDSLCGFSPGTLLLLDFPCTFAPVDQPDEIRRKDPWLSGEGKPSAWRDRVMAFFSGPLRRYVPGFESADIRMELNLGDSPIAGSYSVEARARVQVSSGPAREFSIFRIKRHEPVSLARMLREIGWNPMDGWPYGQEVGYPRTLYLFSKR